MNSTKYILLTIDVEEWFQVENFKPWVPFSTWDSYKLRVEKNVHRLLNLFDSIASAEKQKVSGAGRLGNWKANSSLQWGAMSSRATEKELRTTSTVHSKAVDIQPPSLMVSQPQTERRSKATFFVLGWIAEKLPHLVREICTRGYEVASHGYNHDLPNKISREKLQRDLRKSKKKLEDITGHPIYGFRSPSFAINDDILKIIQDSGYHYDSSYNSFSLHGRYGQISLNGSEKLGIAHKLTDSFYELPVSNLQLGAWTFPLGGGGYFRLLPTAIFNLGIKAILKQQEAYLLYMHPWEIDPNQPRLKSASLNYKFRHYTNLSKTHSRLEKLIEGFSKYRFVACREYLNLAAGFNLPN